MQRAIVNSEPSRYGSPSHMLTGAELKKAGVTSTEEGVRRLRPEFLRGTPTPAGARVVNVTPTVYLNEKYAGELDALRTIPLDAVEEIRLVRPNEARDFFGVLCHCDAGVILVRTHR